MVRSTSSSFVILWKIAFRRPLHYSPKSFATRQQTPPCADANVCTFSSKCVFVLSITNNGGLVKSTRRGFAQKKISCILPMLCQRVLAVAHFLQVQYDENATCSARRCDDMRAD